MTAPATTTVHWTQPGLVAVPERDGHGDSCGPIVIQDYLHVTQGMPATIAELDTLRQEMIDAGLMTAGGGMTIEGVAGGFYRHGVTPTKVVPWGTVNLDTFHADMLDIAASHRAIVMETHNASALPDGQPNVQNHFVLFWGIDSAQGYWCCNGDTLTALASIDPTSPVWYRWPNIVPSEPSTYLVLPAFDGGTTPSGGGQPVIVIDHDGLGNITGAHDADNGLTLGAGFALVIQQQGWQSAHVRVQERGAGPVRIAVADAATFVFTPDRGVEFVNIPNIADAVTWLFAQLDAAQQQQQPDPTAEALRADLKKFLGV